MVFARVLTADKDVETELVCVTSKYKKDGMGVLQPPPAGNAYVVTVPLQTVRRCDQHNITINELFVLTANCAFALHIFNHHPTGFLTRNANFYLLWARSAALSWPPA